MIYVLVEIYSDFRGDHIYPIYQYIHAPAHAYSLDSILLNSIQFHFHIVRFMSPMSVRTRSIENSIYSILYSIYSILLLLLSISTTAVPNTLSVCTLTLN